jgi:hypothetical protein
MTMHPLAWTAPQPFWSDTAGRVSGRAVLTAPQILRFASDQFMDELLATLEHDPASLTRYAVAEETWRGPGPAPDAQPSRWLERSPTRLLGVQRKAQARARALAAPAPDGVVAATPTKLKLYQPAHLRHYLVSGSLVCQAPGLPDRAVDAGRHKVSFVVRRLLPNANARVARDEPLPDPAQSALWDEYAYVLQGKSGQWHRVSASDALLPGEERLPMFPASFTQDDGHRRRLYVGSVPVGRREAYQGAAAKGGDGAADGAAPDPRTVLFQMQVLGPWKAMVNAAMGTGGTNQSPDDHAALKAARPERVFAANDDGDGYVTGKPDAEALRAERSALQTSSWLLLLDLALFLRDQLPDFWRDHVLPNVAPAGGALRALFDALHAAKMPTGLAGAGWTLATKGTTDHVSLADQAAAYADDVETNLIEALSRAAREQVDGKSFEDLLEAAQTGFALAASGAKPAGWPTFLFLFADPWFGVLQPPSPPGFAPPAGDYLSEKIVARIDTLADRVADVFATLPAGGTPLPEPTLASMQPADMREAWYVMRLAYERPDCKPFEATLVSAPTRPFRMAGFFDPDAPARPIRIGLPMDISPAGLRKFDKNAVFMMSDMLCGQVDRMKGLGLADLVLSVLPWPFHKSLKVPEKGPCKDGQGSLGVMCSLSIPIITICALLLLMIIVSLLDFVFRWLPYFVVCFPLPGFKGKKAAGD